MKETEQDEDRAFLLDGVIHGFNIIDPHASLQPAYQSNHQSVRANFDIADELIMKEVKKGNYIVCDDSVALPTIVSPLGLVPKSDGGHRLIHDCSAPSGKCLNDYSLQLDKCKYESVDSAVDLLKQGNFLAKIDIKSAYRGVAISPDSYHATGLQWNINGKPVTLIDTRLPFGARAAPTIFHKISQFVKRAMLRRGHDLITAYQDDFLVQGVTYEECLNSWITLINLLLYLGFELNYAKLVAPTTDLTFLGVRINSLTMELALPPPKLNEIRCLVATFLNKRHATRRQLQSLAGKLNFAARVVRGGRVFLRRILDAIAKLHHPYHKVCVHGPLKSDIEWWHTCLTIFNGVAACISATSTSSILTDACLKSGGAFYNGDFFYTTWADDVPDVASLPINYKEAMIATLSVARWASGCSNSVVYVYTDNQCAKAIIDKCSCRNSTVMTALRTMFWLSVQYNFVVKSIYIPGVKHVLADTVSRLHEKGRLLQFESLFNDWHLCHTSVGQAFNHVSLCIHISLASVFYLLEQALAWRKLRLSWTH